MPPHPWTNFEIQKYCQNKPRFNGIFSRDNLPKRNSIEIRDEAYIINLDEYYDIRAHWIALYVKNNGATLELNIFQKKLKHFLVIKTWKQIFLE